MMRSVLHHPALWVALGVVLASHPVRGQTPNHEILVSSPAMTAGEMVPRDYTPDGRNLSPPLTWSNLPAGTREIAVVCSDFGAGNPPPWVHWIIYSIPATATGLPAGLPILPDTAMPPELTGAIQGLNGWRRPYYRRAHRTSTTSRSMHSTKHWDSDPDSPAANCSVRWRDTSSGRVRSYRSTNGFESRVVLQRTCLTRLDRSAS